MSKTHTEEEIFSILSTKTGETPEALKVEFEAFVELYKKSEKPIEFEKLDSDKLRLVARNQFTTKKLREARSPATTWQGMIVGVGDMVDTVARARKASIEAFEKAPEQAVKGLIYKFKGQDIAILVKSESVLDGETGKMETRVVPLYPKTDVNDKFKRTGTAMPEHNYIRSVFGIASPMDKKTKVFGPPQPFVMTTDAKNKNYAVYAKNIPMFQPVVFQGIDKTTTEDKGRNEYRIGTSAYTEFKVEPNLPLPPIDTLIEAGLMSRFVILGELDEYHDKNEKDNQRWCVTQGTVGAGLDLTPNAKTGNLRMRLEDESLMFMGGDGKESFGIQCWIPTDRNIVIDFGQDSRVYVVGKTNRGKGYDRETKTQLDTPGDVQINAYGIYCPELFKVSAEIAPIGPDAVAPDDVDADWIDPDKVDV